MKIVKVFVREGFSSVHDGAYGPGECEMALSVAKRYPMFVTILEVQEGEGDQPKKVVKKSPAVKKVAPTSSKKASGPITRTKAKAIRKTTTRKPKK